MPGKKYDVLIIGGGPIGLACGIEAKRAELDYIVVEKGCLVNSLYNYPVNMTFFSTAERLEIGDIPFMSTNPKPRRPEALEYYRRVAQQFSINIHLFENVLRIDGVDNEFVVHTSKDVYNARKIIVATGFYDLPALMQIPGEDLPKVHHYYKDPHYYAAQHVAIAGASNSAVDAALETYRKGAQVTMVVRGPEIGKRVKYWVRPDIINRIEEGSIKAYFNSSIQAISDHAVDILTPEGQITISNDFVLAMTGYRPNFSFLRSLGINLSDDGKMYPQYDPENMETNVKGLYLAGVICGGVETHKWFIENSRVHAKMIINDIR
ncbi:MAG TPA: YpdA family putative bacillithiol disulfide reductase [Flavipsychrobacter sp.]|nr:YpdA family putative bacillithiol disulfide reductase [Flavipsychrobacter sp.]